MKIEDFIEARKKDVIEKWFKLVIETYSSDTAHFLKSQKDPFANPVGSSILSGLNALLEGLLGSADEKEIKTFLDRIIRIRAIQTIFSPSQATAFIFDLKKVIRDIVKNELSKADVLRELLPFEDKIDSLGLSAFDVFVECREQIYEIKANQERSKVFRAFERAGLVTEIQEE
jgi:hypothetical protein